MEPMCTTTDLVPIIDSILSRDLPDAFRVRWSPMSTVHMSDLLSTKDAAMSYISKCTRTYDDETLQALEVRLNQLRGDPRTITERIGRVLEAIRHTTPDVKPAHGKVQWMSRVRVLVERVIAPDSVGWMEDDSSMSKSSYMTRALSDIRNRFERLVLCKYHKFQVTHIK